MEEQEENMEQELIELAQSAGADRAAVMPADNLVIIPAYRQYCEENLCGNFGKHPACPPACGTVAEMTDRVRAYRSALILQKEIAAPDPADTAAAKAAKRTLNILTEKLKNLLEEKSGETILMMSAGPWKTSSCMSAYSVDAQKMAECAGLKCWADDGKWRFFTLLLFQKTGA